MKLTGSKMLEDCFDGSSVILYSFDRSWSRESIMLLKELGELSYYPDFPRPFFRLICRNGLQVKGVEGDEHCRAIYPGDEREVIQKQFEDFFDE